MLDREAAKTAIDLDLATSEFQGLSFEVGEKERSCTQVQEQCFGTEASLTDTRKQASDLAPEVLCWHKPLSSSFHGSPPNRCAEAKVSYRIGHSLQDCDKVG